MGLEQTSIVTTVNNLGLIYADLGQLDEAEKMCQRTLTSYEKALGPQSGENICIGAKTAQNIVSLFQLTSRTLEAEDRVSLVFQSF
jgi:hypothetical protein